MGHANSCPREQEVGIEPPAPRHRRGLGELQPAIPYGRLFPGYVPRAGGRPIGEYNCKFHGQPEWCVLEGGLHGDTDGHMRTTYRHFLPAPRALGEKKCSVWVFRLAEDFAMNGAALVLFARRPTTAPGISRNSVLAGGFGRARRAPIPPPSSYTTRAVRALFDQIWASYPIYLLRGLADVNPAAMRADWPELAVPRVARLSSFFWAAAST